MAFPARAQVFDSLFSYADTSFPAPSFGSPALADFDGDGDWDFHAVGQPYEAYKVAEYDGLFQAQEGAYRPWLSFRQYYRAQEERAWGDFNQDGKPDLYLSSRALMSDGKVKIHAVIAFSEAASQSVRQDTLGMLSWGKPVSFDVDGDGDQDILQPGRDNQQPGAILEMHNGKVAARREILPCTGLATADDFDADGDEDVACFEFSSVHIFRNDAGRLVDLAGLPGFQPPVDSGGIEILPLWSNGSLQWQDLDGDGDKELIVQGQVTSGPSHYLTTIYYCENAGYRTPILLLESFNPGEHGFFDADGDGDPDMMRTPWPYNSIRAGETVFFENLDGKLRRHGWLPSVFGYSGFADFNDDGNLDILALDENRGRIHLNRSPPRPPPAAPTGLSSQVTGNTAHLAWDPPGGGTAAWLTYNVRVGRSPGGVDVVSPISDPATGRRRIPEEGNAGARPRFDLHHLGPGTYYWSVQSVNSSWTGSPFAAEGTFTVSAGLMPVPVIVEAKAVNGKMSVLWNRPPGETDGYCRIHGGTQSLGNAILDSTASLADTSRVLDLPVATEYWFEVSCTDGKGRESRRSAAVQADGTSLGVSRVRPAAPSGTLRVSGIRRGAGGGLELAFTLAGKSDVAFALFGLDGARAVSRSLPGLAAGPHLIRLPAPAGRGLGAYRLRVGNTLVTGLVPP